MPLHALTRSVSRSLAACELLHLPRQQIDPALATRQHAGYVAALEAAGVPVTVLPEVPEHPDAVFVEDPAVVLDELVIVGRPGARSREAEAALLRPALARIRSRIVTIAAPGTLEGGDVLRHGRTLFVGRSSRTNAEGIRQLRDQAAPLGYEVREVAVTGCLHLKTAATSPAPGLLLANRGWIDLAPFADFEIVSVPVEEPWGANCLPLPGTVLVTASAPRTTDLLAARGLTVRVVNISELQKAEAGLTCLSVIYSTGST